MTYGPVSQKLFTAVSTIQSRNGHISRIIFMSHVYIDNQCFGIISSANSYSLASSLHEKLDLLTFTHEQI